jgi:hypothetical protein
MVDHPDFSLMEANNCSEQNIPEIYAIRADTVSTLLQVCRILNRLNDTSLTESADFVIQIRTNALFSVQTLTLYLHGYVPPFDQLN